MSIVQTEEYLSKMRLLVVAPHADDEVAGAGGLISRVKEAGGEAYVMVFTVADLDHFDQNDHSVTGHTREEELNNAMEYLDVDGWEVLMRDQSDAHLRLESIPRRNLVNYIEQESTYSTESLEPNAICLPAPSFNQDHEAVYKAGITACRPHLSTLKDFQQMVLIADAPQLSWPPDPDTFTPNMYVNISGKHLEKKLEAFRCHESQLRPDPHQGGVESIRLLAKSRGREISVEAAEAFECHRFVL